MRRIPISIVIVAVACIATVSPPALGRSSGGRPTAKCPPASSHVVAVGLQAAVFEAREPGGFPYERGLYGCALGRRQTYHLGEVPDCGIASTCGGVRREQLAGTFVAYESFFSGVESEWYVAVRDLRNGRLVHHVPTGTPVHHAPNAAGVGPITDLVVKTDGSVAWIAEDEERASPKTATSPEILYYDVYAADKSGTRLLAASLEVNPSSLAVAGSTLYWEQGGKPMSGTLN
jgi:hypothetical protein